MSIVNGRYKQLKPEFRYLVDEAVLAQAWKKSHLYIRSHNWYADTLELDCSAVSLERRIKTWANEILKKTYTPSKMRLIPAPKTDKWRFFEKEISGSTEWNWGACTKNSGGTVEMAPPKELRPLAHLNIQDQTVATAIMLCLADAVETRQGSTNPKDHHRVWSYGNRLFCKWEGGDAHFRWGNSSTYSKYFQDYQYFLERPIRVAKERQSEVGDDQTFYIIHLDLKSFYDSIDRVHLINILKKICDDHYEKDQVQNDQFWTTVTEIITKWEWDQQDLSLASCISSFPVNNGLPQGLVASGFFANAYLIGLDEQIGSMIGNKFGDVTLVDYCRYVDDIRLLVHVPSNVEPRCWKEWVRRNLQEVVEKTTKGINLNPEKTKVERYTAKRSGVSVRMKAIQEAASGPQDVAALNEMLGSLEGLFAMAEQFRDQGEQDIDACDIALAKVDRPQMDVRDDTLLRFTANRITKALSDKRLLTNSDDTDADSISELDHIYESIARRFVAAWSRNPALILVLKKGFGLFPHQQLLQPVLEALFGKIRSLDADAPINEQRIVFYCLAELFRFSALELHRQKPEQRPKHADWYGFKSLLSYTARKLLQDPTLPWYLQQQLALFCVVSGDNICPSRLGKTDQYHILFCVLCGNHHFETEADVDKRTAAFIVAFQMSLDKNVIVANLGGWLAWLYKNEHYETAAGILEDVALNKAPLYESLLSYGQQIEADWYLQAERVSHLYGLSSRPLEGDLVKQNGKPISLASVILRSDNPFQHENALLVLAWAAINYIENKKKKHETINLIPHLLIIQCEDWAVIQHAKIKDSGFLRLMDSSFASSDLRYDPPQWLEDNDDNIDLYRLGCFLRACIIGDNDFTGRQFLLRDDTSHGYFGLKTNWYKRRLGMAHQPESLNGNVAPMTAWVSELLYRLLQWPGLDVQIHSEEWQSKLNINSVKKKILERWKIQVELYGTASDLPVYVLKVGGAKREQSLRVVMVQSLLPRKEDFNGKDLQFDDPKFRARHREHTATMTQLVLKKLNALQQAATKVDSDGKKPLADLIVFPELSVHPNDVVYLKKLADKTGAMIFAGLTYVLHGGESINTAEWLIPFDTGHGRQWIRRRQGKWHLTTGEKELNVKQWRPYQIVIELADTLMGQPNGFRMSGAICYDATNISLAADLKDVTNAFIVSALNPDVNTFDTMVDALHYHMYQPVVLVNTGEFGGSASKAPYKEIYDKRIAHVHGSNQIAVSIFDLNMHDFSKKSKKLGSGKETKTPPAGIKRILR